MIITKKHADLMRSFKEKWGQGLALDKVIDQLSEEDLEYILHLDLAGLVEETEEGFCFSQAGHMVSEAIDECIKTIGNYESWPENFKFIGSEVISMIEVVRLAQGDTKKQPHISKELERRGLAKDGKLLPVAESILEAYDIAFPRISLDKKLIEGLKKSPPGPGNKALLPFDKEQIYELEAMRLLTFSLPYGNSYSLTGPGQQLRSSLLYGLAPSNVIDDELLLALLQDEIDESLKTQLQTIGALDSNGELLPAGRALLAAAHLLYVEPIELNPSITIKDIDFTVLDTINSLESPTNKAIKAYLEEENKLSKAQVQNSLFVLESFRLIEEESEDTGLIYKLTDFGNEILTDRKNYGFNEVSAKAVMAITTTRMENLSPDDEWIKLSEEEGLIGKGYVTKSGALFARVASSIDRLPLVDALQRKVLNVLPFWRGLFLESIIEFLKDLKKEEIDLALDRLVANGLVDLLPGGLYKITQAGVAFKRAMSVVPDGIEYHVTPHILRVLIAASHNTVGGKIDWKKTERECGLDSKVMNETLLHMRKLIYIKSDKITNAGKLLLEGVELLSKAKLSWNEVNI